MDDKNQQIIKSNNEKIEENNKNLSKLQTGYNTVYQKQVDIQTQIQTLKKSQIENNVNINSIKSKITLFSNDKCPTCGTSFNTEIFKNLKQQLNDLLIQKNEINDKLNEQLKQLNDNAKSVQEYLNKINNAVYKIQQQNTQLSSENYIINAKVSQNGEFKAIQNIINKTQEQIEEVKEHIEEKNKEMLDLQNLLVVYSIDGVKQKVINNYLPLLNKEID